MDTDVPFWGALSGPHLILTVAALLGSIYLGIRQWIDTRPPKPCKPALVYSPVTQRAAIDDPNVPTTQDSFPPLLPNPQKAFRGAECMRFTDAFSLPALGSNDVASSFTSYQAMFACDSFSKADNNISKACVAWQQSNVVKRVSLATKVQTNNNFLAKILLAEEHADTIEDAEELLREAMRGAERFLKSKNPYYLTDNTDIFWLAEETWPYLYARWRLGICLRKQGRCKEALRLFRELVSYKSMANSLAGVQSNLIETLVALNYWADVKIAVEKFEALAGPSTVTVFTTALLKMREVAKEFSLQRFVKKRYYPQEQETMQALYRAFEYNPHVFKYLLERKRRIVPPEHFIPRGDSEALCYVFDHFQHWQKEPNGLIMLDYIIEFPQTIPNYFDPYPENNANVDVWLLPKHHSVSVFPEVEMPLHVVVLVVVILTLGAGVFYLEIHPDLRQSIAELLTVWT
eukprot:m.81866 g.81866  ORF g.81866 m.81866 type:complete len:460 (-) comp21013_c0_seq3:162-1541(-)